MNKMDELRAELDKVNREIAKQLENRFQILENVWREKKSQNLPLHDSKRVEEMIQKISLELADSKNKEYIVPVFIKIFDESLRYLENEAK